MKSSTKKALIVGGVAVGLGGVLLAVYLLTKNSGVQNLPNGGTVQLGTSGPAPTINTTTGQTISLALPTGATWVSISDTAGVTSGSATAGAATNATFTATVNTTITAVYTMGANNASTETIAVNVTAPTSITVTAPTVTAGG